MQVSPGAFDKAAVSFTACKSECTVSLIHAVWSVPVETVIKALVSVASFREKE
jgi:hypothetical protein